MNRVCRIAILLLSLAFPLGCVPRHAVDLRAVDIDAIRQRHHLPALAVAEQRDGKIVAQYYTGTRKIGDPTPVGPGR